MLQFAYLWPWMGLGAAALLLVLLFATDALRTDVLVTRWRDLVWLTWLAVAAYLLHQFEEHGIDAQGFPYAFRGNLCHVMGFHDAATCPIPLAFITAVNIPAVWLAGTLSALLGRRWPAIGLSFFSVLFVNAFAHILPAIGSASYNPGLVTACLLFLPLSIWMFILAANRAELGSKAVFATIGAGVLLHVVLMASLLGFIAGFYGLAVLVAIQIVNPALPPLVLWLAAGSGRAPVKSLAPTLQAGHSRAP